ncbi:ABC-2 family transporter permease [Olsenella massiliensis]|uniref:ABC transporter permease n=1 Tax=Olsenella massiliensis TaxID=1622075 RepID=UPI00071CAEA4|nr:ABC transporter permease [Olsenella massiliensis]
MGTLIKFEIRKILGNRAGMAACLAALALLAGMAFMNLATMSTRDFATGEVVEGLAAQQTYLQKEESHAGLLDDAQVAEDAATLDRANQLAKGTPGFYDLSSDEIIAQYGLGFWQQTRAVASDDYYNEIVGTLDSASPRSTSLREGSLARVDASLSDGFEHYFPYSDAEVSYWHDKFDQIKWPVEFGYAGAWKNALDWASSQAFAIVALCIALSGVYAGEYQNRTAAVALPTRRGKRALPAAKAVAALAFATAYWWLCAAVVVGINVAVCGAGGWDLPAQVVFGFNNPYPLTVGQAMLAVYGLGYLIAIGMAALTLLLSSKMRSTMPVAVIPMAVAFLGMFALFISPLAKLGALTPMAGMNFAFSRMVSFAAGTAVIDLPTALAILYAVLLAACTPLAMRVFARHQVA